MLARECSDVPKLAENAGEVNDVEINKRCDYEIRVLSLHVLLYFGGRKGLISRAVGDRVASVST